MGTLIVVERTVRIVEKIPLNKDFFPDINLDDPDAAQKAAQETRSMLFPDKIDLFAQGLSDMSEDCYTEEVSIEVIPDEDLFDSVLGESVLKTDALAKHKLDTVPDGLCANREDHEPHLVTVGSLAPFWCTADQSQREPFRSEQQRREEQQ